MVTLSLIDKIFFFLFLFCLDCNCDLLNVFGLPLEPCSFEPLTGYYRDGYCNTGPGDLGSHTVCAVINEDFLEHQKSEGNDLITPRPIYNFSGLKPGNRWAVCAIRWKQSYKVGKACRVILESTNIRALNIIPFEYLKEYEFKGKK